MHTVEVRNSRSVCDGRKNNKICDKKRAAIFLVFLAAFFAGNIAAACVMKYQGTEERQSGINGMTEMKGGNNADASENVENKEAETARNCSTVLRDAAEGNWGLSFQEEGKPPVGNAAPDYLLQYDAYYAGAADQRSST